MYLLETIEGKRGEELTSAILKYLFINSDQFRRLFLKRIDKDFTASNRPVFKNGVICFDEHPTDDSDGFIDLVVVADNAVLGVENKLWAGLTDNQPSKYLPALQRLAGERCGNGEAYKILMLVPEQRLKEIRKELDTQGVPSNKRIVLAWQAVMEDVQEVAREETGEVTSVAMALHEYLDHRLGEVNVNAAPAKLVGDVELGNVFQQDFLNKVWAVFENAGRISSGGKGWDRKWYGFYFGFADLHIGVWDRPWFGFIEKDGAVRLIIETHQKDFPSMESFAPLPEYSTPGDIRVGVAFDKTDDSVPKWSEKLLPALEELRKRFGSCEGLQRGAGESVIP